MSFSCSVIIPTFNRSQMLLAAVQSVLQQTVLPKEIIVVDDGSTEPIESIITEIQSPLVRYIHQAHTGMPGQVRNVGVAQAEGEWIAFLDSDDLWYPEKLQCTEAIITTDAPSLIHCRERWMRCGSEVSQRKQRHQRRGNIFQDCLKKCIIGPSTVVMKRSVYDDLGGFREDLEIAEDYEFWLRYCNTYAVEYIDETLVEKRAGDWEQLSVKYDEIEIFRMRGLQELIDRKIFTEPHQLLAKEEFARKCEIYSKGAEKRGLFAKAEEFAHLAKTYR